MRFLSVMVVGLLLVPACVASDRDEDAELTDGAQGQTGEEGADESEGESSVAFLGCGCPDADPDPAQVCDLATMRATFSACGEGIANPCSDITLDCDDVPLADGPLDCVLENLAARADMLYSIERAACEGRDSYRVVMRIEEPSPALAIGLECYGGEHTQIPMEAMFSPAERFGECLMIEDRGDRYGCLFGGTGFAEPHRARCP